MLFVTTEEFFAKAKEMSRLGPEDEQRLAREIHQNAAAREQIICSYFPMVAASIRRAPRELHTLQTVYSCLATLENAVDSFPFSRDSKGFSHYLGCRLRQCIAGCIADRN